MKEQRLAEEDESLCARVNYARITYSIYSGDKPLIWVVGPSPRPRRPQAPNATRDHHLRPFMTSSVPLSRTGTPTQRYNTSRTASPRNDSAIQHIVSFENVEEIARDIHPRWKRELYLLLERPTSSPGAFLIHVVTTSLIVISALVTILETIPSSHSISGSVWFGLETSLVAMFTIEYIGRAVAHSGSWTMLARWAICTSSPRCDCVRR